MTRVAKATGRQRSSRLRYGRSIALGCALAANIVLFAGCGFHLRGSVILPAEVETLHLQVPNPELAEEIKLLLAAGEVSMVPSRENADLTLIVAPVRFERRLIAVDPKTGKAREFELIYDTSLRCWAMRAEPSCRLRASIFRAIWSSIPRRLLAAAAKRRSFFPKCTATRRAKLRRACRRRSILNNTLSAAPSAGAARRRAEEACSYDFISLRPISRGGSRQFIS